MLIHDMNHRKEGRRSSIAIVNFKYVYMYHINSLATSPFLFLFNGLNDIGI